MDRVDNFRIAAWVVLLLLIEPFTSGFRTERLSALPFNAPSSVPVSLMQRLWPYGVPRVLEWSRCGIAVGTSAGYVILFSEDGDLKWWRKVNYTSVWSIAWSETGELAVATLGPPGVLYVFNSEGDLLWSREWETSQVYSVAWSGELLAVAAGDLSVFNRKGELKWSYAGSTLAVSWRNGRIAASKSVVEPHRHYWNLQVLDGDGKLLWNRSGSYDFLAWSEDCYLAAAERYKGVVSVFDSAGALVWEKTLGKGEIGSLAWFGELLVVGSEKGVTAFDKSGRETWSYGCSFVEALSAMGGSLAVGDYAGNLTLLDANGKLLWSYWTCGYVWAIDWYGDRVAAASSDGYVQVLDAKGRLLWKHKVGFNVEAVAVNGDLVAVGGWDLNVYVFDLNGSLKWSRETGWVSHLAWYGDYLAVGGYEKTFVFRSDGNLMWEFNTGKVRSLSWSDDGLLAVGCTNILAVFELDGKLLWSALVPDWVLSVSWSGELLAAAVAGQGVYVSNRSGALKFVFKSVFENATIPWRVSASWWGDRLVVVTDRVYAIDREGELLWVNEFVPADTLAPGGDFVALGSGRGVGVVDGDGELEWSYLTPDYASPKELYTKLYLRDVHSLAWVDSYLVVGDSLGRVVVFNESGDVIQVFDMGDVVWSVSGGGRGVFAAGGGGGLVIASVHPVERPPKKILAQLPPPYDKFEVAIANRTLLYLNGSIQLERSQPLSFQFTVSESAPYAFLEASLSSTRPVKLTLTTQAAYGRLGGGFTDLSWSGTVIQVNVPLKPGTYSLVVHSEEDTMLNCTLHAYEGFLPFFEGRRVYLPVGIADYGYAELPEGRIGYRYAFTEVWGYATIANLSAARPFGEDGEKHWVTLQLNAFLHANTEGGRQVYWVQNVAVLDTLNRQAGFACSVWNATTYPISVLARWAVEGKGSLSREKRTGDYYVYSSPWVGYSYPLDLALYLSVQVENGRVKVSVGRFSSGGEFEIFDVVALSVKAGSAYFKVDPTERFTPSNLELVFAGPHGGKPKTNLLEVNASLKLLVNVNGSLIPVPTAYSCGYATYERVANASVGFGGDHTIVVALGRARMHQVYYSSGAFTPLQAVVVRDPLKLYSGLFFLKPGEAFPLLPGNVVVDLGNMTRYLLKGYATTGKNEVSLEWKKQFYLEVVSAHGEVKGEGWYDEGSYARVELSETVEGFLVRQVFEHWEGLKPEDRVLAAGIVEVYMEGPRKLEAVWKTDYTQLIVVIVAVGALLAAIACRKYVKRGR